jgi:hypothetical protein
MTRHEELYRKTGNPLYIMAEINDYCPRGQPWPAWVEEYVREIARRMIVMAEADKPSEAAALVAGAMGLTGRGRNRFADYKMDRRTETVLWAHGPGRTLFANGSGKKPLDKTVDHWVVEAINSQPGGKKVTVGAVRKWKERWKTRKRKV